MEDLTTSPFDAIRRTDEQGREYWSARELGKVLGYTEYNKFKNAIRKAEEACKDSGESASDHFARVSDMIQLGKGALLHSCLSILLLALYPNLR